VTERLFRDDAYLLEFDALVVGRRQHQGRPAVVLDRTAFYAESGGQPWDEGSLDGVPVVAVVEDGTELVHVLAGALPASRVHGQVDGERRRDHRQQHHGQHLLSRAFVERAGAATLSFHLGGEESTIDLDRTVDEAAIRAVERRANEVIWEGRPVSVRTATRAEAAALGVKPPEEAGDAVRLVEAEGFDLQACGGTHPRNTAEVGVVLVLGQERYKSGIRVRFVCGHRALASFGRRAAVLDRLGALLSAPLEELDGAAQRALDQVADAHRRSRELLERGVQAEALRLLAVHPRRPALLVAAYDGWAAEELRELATRLVRLEPCVVLLGSRAGKVHLVFAQSEGLGHDIPGLLRDAAAVVGGRGGGKGSLAQGGGERLERLDEALAQAASRVGGALPGSA
jgi:alanyl-tRNA synthetase